MYSYTRSMRRNTKSKKPSKKRSKQSNRGKGIRGGQTTLVVIPRTFSQGMPDRLRTTLTAYVELAPSWAATSAVTHRYRATGCNGWDIVGGAGRPPYFAELAAIYASYRVTQSTCKVVASAGAAGVFPVTITVVPLNADPGATPIAQAALARELPYARFKTLGSYGSRSVTVSNTMTTAKLYGSNMVLSDDAFASLTSSDPTNLWYWAIIFYQNITATATTPFYYSIQLWFDIEFYDRKFVITAAPKDPTSSGVLIVDEHCLPTLTQQPVRLSRCFSCNSQDTFPP